MSTLSVAGTSIAMMLILIGLRVPIGVAMGGVAFLGLWYLRNFNVALSVLRDTPFVFAANWDLSAIPMFLLMGAIASNTGIGAGLFRAAYAWFGGMPGGLAVATNWACAGFGAASGSSIAAAAVMARLAVPEMLKNKYDKALATGVCASGGTLDALIPPSILFVIYGVFAEVSISKLLLAGIIPGLLTAAVYMIMIVARCWLNPKLGPPVEFSSRGEMWRERWASLRDIWPILVLIVAVMGGLYWGVVSPTESGAAGALVGDIDRRAAGQADAARLHRQLQGRHRHHRAIVLRRHRRGASTPSSWRCRAARPCSPKWSATWALDPILLVIAVSVIYLILGMFLDPLGMILLTIPVFVPMFAALNLDLVWFGVLVVKYIGIGLLTPPVGFNIYVVSGALNNQIPLTTIFRGCYWFLACEVVIMTLLIAFPQISLWLPSTMN